MRVYLQSNSLIFREFTERDLDSLVVLNGDPKVLTHLTGGIPLSPDFVRQEILPCFLRFHAETPDFGYWAAVTKDQHDFLGWFQFRPRNNHGGGIELGFRLKPSEWGKGYATEGSRALVANGFSKLGVQRVFARTMASNDASIRVLEKAGLKFEYRYWEPEFPEGQQAAVVYSLNNSLPTGSKLAGEVTDGSHSTAIQPPCGP